MSETEKLQEEFADKSTQTSKRGRKKMEKMETEVATIKFDENGAISCGNSGTVEHTGYTVTRGNTTVDNGVPCIPTKAVTKWIVKSNGTKTCEACGAVMMGWAFREKLNYCPKCGAKAEKA